MASKSDHLPQIKRSEPLWLGHLYFINSFTWNGMDFGGNLSFFKDLNMAWAWHKENHNRKKFKTGLSIIFKVCGDILK